MSCVLILLGSALLGSDQFFRCKSTSRCGAHV